MTPSEKARAQAVEERAKTDAARHHEDRARFDYCAEQFDDLAATLDAEPGPNVRADALRGAYVGGWREALFRHKPEDFNRAAQVIEAEKVWHEQWGKHFPKTQQKAEPGLAVEQAMRVAEEAREAIINASEVDQPYSFEGEDIRARVIHGEINLAAIVSRVLSPLATEQSRLHRAVSEAAMAGRAAWLAIQALDSTDDDAWEAANMVIQDTSVRELAACDALRAHIAEHGMLT